MARLTVPSTIPGTVAPALAYRSDPPAGEEERNAGPMSEEAYRRYHEILATWRAQGRRLGWRELKEAYRLAREESNPGAGDARPTLHAQRRSDRHE
jgi:hypothetical protein